MLEWVKVNKKVVSVIISKVAGKRQNQPPDDTLSVTKKSVKSEQILVR